MKISIITVCLNSEKTIKKAIESVNFQNYVDYEHIFIDGGSTDNTVDLIKANAISSVIISEKDNNIYDAMNKGINVAKGEIICFLNSDDYYLKNNVFETVCKIAKTSEQKKILIACNTEIFNPIKKSSSLFKSYGSGSFPLLYNQLPHPSLFIKTDSKKELLFNDKFPIAADLHQQFRLKFLEGYHLIVSNFTSTRLIIGGASTGSLKKYFRNFYEIRDVYNNLFESMGYIYSILRSIKNFFRRITSINTYFN